MLLHSMKLYTDAHSFLYSCMYSRMHCSAFLNDVRGKPNEFVL